MPWLPLYLTKTDASAVIDLLAEDPEVAFLAPNGPRQWRAVKSISAEGIKRVGLWHVPSGPLPLLPATHGDPIQQVQDPWLGWTEKRTGEDPTTPYFGAGHPGVVWLNLRTEGKDQGSCCGFSSFEWIGNRYKVIGSSAAPSTEIWWKSLRRRVSKLSHRVPRHRLSDSSSPEVFAFPGAYSLLIAGGAADANPL